MHHHRLTRIATLALAIGALSAPTAIAQQDLRSPDAIDAAQQARQNLRSPTRSTRQAPPQAQQGTAVPDARDPPTAAAPTTPGGRVPQGPAPRAHRRAPLGRRRHRAGALLGLILLALGGALLVVHRRHTRPI